MVHEAVLWFVFETWLGDWLCWLLEAVCGLALVPVEDIALADFETSLDAAGGSIGVGGYEVVELLREF
jgi:hypothetical protein